ncbi:vacuolar protein sorting-associated protein 13 domain-containing protein [Tanacetum coccineum]
MEMGKGAGDNLGTGMKNDSIGNKLKQNVVFNPVVSCYFGSFEQPTSSRLKNTTNGEPEGKWNPSSKLSKEELTFVPVWIKFHGVLRSAFTIDGLSAIAIRLGTPVIDLCTVEYEWKPQRCGTCLVFGHDDAWCPKRGIVDLRNLGKQGGTCLHQLTIKRRKSTPVSNSFSTLEDDNDTPMHNLVDGIKKKVTTPFRKTGIWLGKKKEYSSKSGFTSPNPFDLLTKDDGKSMLRDLQESDDDPDEDDGSDETAHSSKLLEEDADLDEIQPSETKISEEYDLPRSDYTQISNSKTFPGPFVIVEISWKAEDGLLIVVSPLLRIHNKTDIHFQWPENQGNDHASVVLKGGDTTIPKISVDSVGWSDELKGGKAARLSGLFDKIKGEVNDMHFLIHSSRRDVPIFQSERRGSSVALLEQKEIYILPTVQISNLLQSEIHVLLTDKDHYFPQDGEDMRKQATISCRSSVNLYANPEEMFFTVTLTAFGVGCKPVNCGDWVKMLLRKKKDDRNLDMKLNFGDGKFFGCLRLSCGHRGILEAAIFTPYTLKNKTNFGIAKTFSLSKLKHKLHDGAKVVEKHTTLYSALSQLASDFDGENMMLLQRFFHARVKHVVSTGSLKLDLALGIGGLPKFLLISLLESKDYQRQKKLVLGNQKERKCKTFWLQTPSMDTDKVKVYGARVRVHTMSKIAKIDRAEKDKMREKVQKIIRHGITLLLTDINLTIFPEELFADAGILAIEHADFDGIERPALVTAGEIA